MLANPGKWQEGQQQITRLVQDGPPQLMVANSGKWQEGPQQITRLVQEGPPQLMVENPGKWRERPHWILRTTNKTAPLGAPKYWKRKYQSLLLLLFLALDSFYFVLFCFVLSIMGLKNRGRLIHKSTYAWENTVTLALTLNVLSVWWYIKFYNVFCFLLCFFLLLHNQMDPFAQCL